MTSDWLAALIQNVHVERPTIGSTEMNPMVKVLFWVPLDQWEEAQIRAGVKKRRTGSALADTDHPGWA